MRAGGQRSATCGARHDGAIDHLHTRTDLQQRVHGVVKVLGAAIVHLDRDAVDRGLVPGALDAVASIGAADSAEDAGDLPEPAVLAQGAMEELSGALAELEAILAELGEETPA